LVGKRGGWWGGGVKGGGSLVSGENLLVVVLAPGGPPPPPRPSQWARVSSFTRFIDHTQRTTIGRTPLDEWSTSPRDLCLTTHNSHQTNIHAPGEIRTHNLSRRAAADLRLRPRAHWERSDSFIIVIKTKGDKLNLFIIWLLLQTHRFWKQICFHDRV